ncbi:MAG TPA: glycolate oxidase subunit GlcE [Rhodocyclaceae bacterium]|nr:glycolate oxidase subunit GlcE [Rhodocyclaceae bacterium]
MQFEDLVGKVRESAETGTALRLKGGGSKDFYGGMLAGEIMDLSGYRGIVAYEPTELYITARCGTPLSEMEAALAEKGQMLAFEPPHFGSATVGGCVAAGLSGPRRQQAGAVRDFVLGVKLIDGTGRVLDFGGQVMKNVAGYDVSRLMAGSLGTLGLIAEVTLKVLPRPMAETSLVFETDQAGAIERLNRWGGRPLPISASFWFDGALMVRLSGASAAVAAAREKLGGELLPSADAFWRAIREQTSGAFRGEVLWRLSLPSVAAPIDLPGQPSLEWGGAQRWLATDVEVASVREAARRAGGHAVLFRAPESLRCREGAFAPLPTALLALHRRLKKVFDPKGIFNPERLYAEL